MSETGQFKIRPAGRLLITIGRELIQDPYAAVVELVKNAYDADSPDVTIRFSRLPQPDRYCIAVSDNGHGMTRDDVINKWLVPSTSDKLRRVRSPAGRIMQGRKGVGRYAASILGPDLFLETVTVDGQKTEAYIDWTAFEKAVYLDDVEVLVETSQTNLSPGTRLSISGGRETIEEWTEGQFDRLRFELRRLKSPITSTLANDGFAITLEASQFPGVKDFSEAVEPYPIFDLFDYKISGQISAEGNGTLEFALQKVRNYPSEEIAFDLGHHTGCGNLMIDIRVYDRDSNSITSLIGRGLRSDSGNYLGNLQARQVLNQYNGIGVYRNGFRIRPLGDPEFDWLKLNEQRVQNPSLRIGSNQVIGLVLIESEEQSGLIEKSARDGIRENYAFDCLKTITKAVIAELETRRFQYRRISGLSQPAVRVGQSFDRLFSNEGLRRDISARLTGSGVSQEVTKVIVEAINQDEEERSKVVDEVRQAVGIYQGQATLGKIVNAIRHEVRRPLNFFRTQIPNLRYWHDQVLKTNDRHALEEAVSIIGLVGDNAEQVVNLFRRLDPLASGNRGPRESMKLKQPIEGSFAPFTAEMESLGVCFHIVCPEDFQFYGWTQDVYVIFTNLIENSLYWMEQGSDGERRISIEAVVDCGSLVHIDYRDTGPGIDPSLIANEVIFEPQFTTKPLGTGIGLPIAGEAAARNHLELRALESDSGAWFRLLPSEEKDT